MCDKLAIEFLTFLFRFNSSIPPPPRLLSIHISIQYPMKHQKSRCCCKQRIPPAASLRVPSKFWVAILGV